MRSFFRSLLLPLFALLLSASAYAQSATYNAANRTLFIPQVVVTGLTYQNVNITLSNLGQVRVNDASVGNAASYDLGTNVLRLPQVSVGGVTYGKVSLTGATFDVNSVGGVVGGTGNPAQRWAVNISVNVPGLPMPPIYVANVTKPASSAEFCKEDNYRMMDQTARAFGATYQVQGCSYADGVGSLSGVVFMDGDAYPVTARYSYVAM